MELRVIIGLLISFTGIGMAIGGIIVCLISLITVRGNDIDAEISKRHFLKTAMFVFFAALFTIGVADIFIAYYIRAVVDIIFSALALFGFFWIQFKTLKLLGKTKNLIKLSQEKDSK